MATHWAYPAPPPTGEMVFEYAWWCLAWLVCETIPTPSWAQANLTSVKLNYTETGTKLVENKLLLCCVVVILIEKTITAQMSTMKKCFFFSTLSQQLGSSLADLHKVGVMVMADKVEPKDFILVLKVGEQKLKLGTLELKI